MSAPAPAPVVGVEGMSLGVYAVLRREADDLIVQHVQKPEQLRQITLKLVDASLMVHEGVLVPYFKVVDGDRGGIAIVHIPDGEEPDFSRIAAEAVRISEGDIRRLKLRRMAKVS